MDGLTMLIAMGIQSTVIGAAGLITARLVRRHGAATESSVLRATLLAALLCPGVMLVLGHAGVDGIDLRPVGTAPSDVPASPSVERTVTSGAAASLDASGSRPAAAPEPVHMAAPHIDPLSEVAAPAGGSRIDWPAALWAIVASLLLLRLAVRYAATRALRRTSRPAPRSFADACVTLASQMGVSPPSVRVSDAVTSPCLVGFKRPVIVFPSVADESASTRDVLAHELAHLERRDCAWRLVAQVASALLFFQPLVWVLSRRLDRAAEHACDDHVVRLGCDRAAYATRLVDLAERQQRWASPVGAVGVVSLRSAVGERVERVLDSTRRISIRTGARRVAAIAILAAGATLATALLGAESGLAKSRADGDTITGRVLDPDGKAVAGARISLKRNVGYIFADASVVATAVSDRDGRYEIDRRAIGRAVLIASAPGFGADFVPEPGREPVTFRLHREVAIHGRLLNSDAEPVPGVRVLVRSLIRTKSGSLDGLIATSKSSGRWNYAEDGWGWFRPEGLIPTVVTDDDGRFVLRGIGAEQRVALVLQGVGMESSAITVLTRESDAEDRLTGGRFDTTATYFARFTHVSAPCRPLRGVVRDKESGSPMANVHVRSGYARTRTDEAGRYELPGLKKRRYHNVFVVADKPLFFDAMFRIDGTPGLDPLTLDVALERGIPVRGRVTDEKTGEPLRGQVEFHAFRPNPRDKRGSPLASPVSRTVTAADGTYAIGALPGPGVVAFQLHDDTRLHCAPVITKDEVKALRDDIWTGPPSLPGGDVLFTAGLPGQCNLRTKHAAALIDVRKGADNELALVASRGRRIEGRVVDPDGEPMRGVRTWGIVDPNRQRTLETDRFVIERWNPRRARRLLFMSADRRHAALRLLNEEAKSPMAVRLAATGCVTGRLVFPDGRPLKTIQVALYPKALRWATDEWLADIDPDGTFRIDGVLSGEPHRIHVRLPPGYVLGKSCFRKVEVTVEPGETVTLPDESFTRGHVRRFPRQ